MDREGNRPVKQKRERQKKTVKKSLRAKDNPRGFYANVWMRMCVLKGIACAKEGFEFSEKKSWVPQKDLSIWNPGIKL